MSFEHMFFNLSTIACLMVVTENNWFSAIIHLGKNK
jgi:hypothetical protein